jgi:hypothetical protein
VSYYQATGAAGPSLADKTEWVKVGGKDVCWDHTINQYVDASFCGAKPKTAAPKTSSPGFFESLTRGIAAAGQIAPGMPGYQPGYPSYSTSGTNTWILPVVGLGAVAILAVVLLKK